MSADSQPDLRWHPERPRLRPLRLVINWLITAVALLVAASLVPEVKVNGLGAALLVALFVAALNAMLPPVIAALRLPFTLVTSFLLILVVDAAILLVSVQRWTATRSTSTASAARWSCRWWPRRRRS